MYSLLQNNDQLMADLVLSIFSPTVLPLPQDYFETNDTHYYILYILICKL